MQIIAIANQKGGTGKTSTALAFAQAAQHKGLKVLCIDLDGQGNFTSALVANPGKGSALDFLEGTRPAAECVHAVGNGVSVIPAVYDLCTLRTERGSANRLKKALASLGGDYDLILIDTPPLAGEAQYNALQAATDLIIPVQTSVYDIKGLFTMTDTAKAMQKSNPALKVAGYILTNHNGRSKLAKALEENLRKEAEAYGVPYLGTVRQAIALREAQALGVSLFEYAPKSAPAIDYMRIFESLISE